MKYLFAFIFCWTSWHAHAQCQLCYLSEAQAKQVVNYLNNDSEAVFYYSNCTQESKDVARRIKIKKAYYKKTDREDRFEVVLEGTIIGTFDVVGRRLENYVKNDMPYSDTIDITYVHIRAGGFMSEEGTQSWEAVSLGIHLGYDCNPCIDPFQYPNQQID